MKKIYLSIIVLFLLVSCYTSPTSIIAPNIDFSQYTFAAIGSDNQGSSVILNEAGMQIQNSLIALGFNVISDTRINTLNSDQRTRLFIVELSISSNIDESVCLIYFTDYLTDNLIATFRGSYGLGWTIAGDQRGAVNSAIRQMESSIQNNLRR